jgi:hypothetical protein
MPALALHAEQGVADRVGMPDRLADAGDAGDPGALRRRRPRLSVQLGGRFDVAKRLASNAKRIGWAISFNVSIALCRGSLFAVCTMAL